MNVLLYKLLVEYKAKELDDNFINTAFAIIMDSEKELVPFVNDLVINEKKADELGTYDYVKRIVGVNKANLFDEEIKTSIKNRKLLALEVIRHELEHARSLKTLYEGRRDIESLIISYTLRDYMLINSLYCGTTKDNECNPFMISFKRKENYIIDPGERLAEIKAWRFIVNLIKNQRRTDDLLMARSMLYYSYVRGYKKNSYYLEAPTYEYLINLGLFRDFYHLKQRVSNTDYCLQTRVTYGLPLSSKEYDEDILKKVRLRKKTK